MFTEASTLTKSNKFRFICLLLNYFLSVARASEGNILLPDVDCKDTLDAYVGQAKVILQGKVLKAPAEELKVSFEKLIKHEPDVDPDLVKYLKIRLSSGPVLVLFEKNGLEFQDSNNLMEGLNVFYLIEDIETFMKVLDTNSKVATLVPCGPNRLVTSLSATKITVLAPVEAPVLPDFQTADVVITKAAPALENKSFFEMVMDFLTGHHTPNSICGNLYFEFRQGNCLRSQQLIGRIIDKSNEDCSLHFFSTDRDKCYHYQGSMVHGEMKTHEIRSFLCSRIGSDILKHDCHSKAAEIGSI